MPAGGRTSPSRRPTDLSGSLYRFHGFRVLDSRGEQVGLVDWIWSDPAKGHGEFVGVNLRWLRGKARPVPALDAKVDMDTGIVQVSYTKDEIKRARFHAIDRELSNAEKRGIWSHYRETPLRTWAEAVAA